MALGAYHQDVTVSSHRLILIAVLLLTIVPTSHAWVDALRANTLPARGDRLSGFVLPVEARDGDINLNALKANVWTIPGHATSPADR